MDDKRRERWLTIVTVFAAIVATVRVVSTYGVFNQTVDEPIHIASGFQLLTTGRYDLDFEHPPLARLTFAIAPALAGAKVDPHADALAQGQQILYRNDRYLENLAACRAGNLLFFLASMFAVYWWALRLSGSTGALVAVAIYGALPPILGHAGLTTTDMAVTATTTLALLTFWRWLTQSTWSAALLFALCVAAGLLSKFSFVMFFGVGAFVVLAATLPARERRQWSTSRIAFQAAVISGLVVVIVWAAYGFSSATVNEIREKIFEPTDPRNVAAHYAEVPGYEWIGPDVISRYWAYGRSIPADKTIDFVDWAKAAGYTSPLAGRHGDTMRGAPPIPPLPAVASVLDPVRRQFSRLEARVKVPAPEMVRGIVKVMRHSEVGHASYFLGEYRDRGWWYYFPLLILLKSPVTFIILVVVGSALLVSSGVREKTSEKIAVAVLPAVMLVPAMASGINIGLRHVLPVYPLMSVAAATAVTSLLASRRRSVFAGILLVAYLGESAAAHPDYLAYFNSFAGRHPDRIAVDSNLDWGQDLLRLATAVRDRHVTHLRLAYFGSARWPATSPAPEALEPGVCTTGTIAISETIVKQGGADHRGSGFRWLEPYRYDEIGRAIRLYDVPRGACPN